MLKSARLIVENIKELTKGLIEHVSDPEAIGAVESIQTELQPDDTMTGFEIIASLPLEEQKRIGISKLDNRVGAYVERQFIKLKLLYKWNGKEWEVYDG